ncbi:hypothetical protein [Chitinophaga sp. Cy-1792]|uniref:hypothetical protein n=1 Tax=Chitinophaga sp. Cy-1792 TaxID=2608339 RepID=UPI00141FA9C8|nr:hypothetical protein [Chitinophaga sp. Cy-1792]NIG53934.1 hypothetical protein [Chitinophaga sp. Cy-1792]
MKKLFFPVIAGVLFVHTAVAQSNTDPASVAFNTPSAISSATPAAPAVSSKAMSRADKKAERKELRKIVSAQTQNQFYSDFGDINVAKWERMPYFDKVFFENDSVSACAFYDTDSKLVGVVYNKTFSDLPPKAQDYINDKMGEYTKGKVIYYHDMTRYNNKTVRDRSQYDDIDNYYIEMSRNGKSAIYEVTPVGSVSYFNTLLH